LFIISDKKANRINKEKKITIAEKIKKKHEEEKNKKRRSKYSIITDLNTTEKNISKNETFKIQNHKSSFDINSNTNFNENSNY
jgi:hypothetical protein